MAVFKEIGFCFCYVIIISFVCVFLINKEFFKNNEKYFFDEGREYSKAVCGTQDTLDNGAFCIEKDNIFYGGNYYADEELCKSIEELIGYSSVGDFGSGFGQYGRCFLRKIPKLSKTQNKQLKQYYLLLQEGLRKVHLLNKPPLIKSYEGFDGETNVEELTENFVKFIELDKRFDLGKKYDWVLSLEVGEHIPAKYEDIFIQNLIHHANKGIIISWAVPGQNGKSHINNRPNEYIIDKFRRKGLVHDKKSQDFLRRKIIYSYFSFTLMVFRKHSFKEENKTTIMND